jgi:hypothetical protein
MRLIKTFPKGVNIEQAINNWVKENDINLLDIQGVNVQDDTWIILYEERKEIQFKKYKDKIKELKDENMLFKMKYCELLNIVKEYQKGGLMLDVDCGKLSISDNDGKLSIKEK